MKKSLLSGAALALALAAGSAFAADLPSHKAPPPYIPPPPLMTWTGFYAGVNAGYTWSDSNWVNTATGPVFATPGFPHGVAPAITNSYLAAFAAATSGNVPVNSSGFIGGGQIGYNWQFASNFLVGVEADIQGVAGSGNSGVLTTAAPVAFLAGEAYIGSVSARKSLDYLGTVRGRLGYLVTPSLLVYGTGGLAYGGVNMSSSVFAFNNIFAFLPPAPAHIPGAGATTAFSDTRVGWTAGGGLEWMFAPRWSAKVEYLYYDLGSVRTSLFIPQIDTVTGFLAAHAGQSTARFNGHVIRAGVNYHFNWGAPAILAKY